MVSLIQLHLHVKIDAHVVYRDYYFIYNNLTWFVIAKHGDRIDLLESMPI